MRIVNWIHRKIRSLYVKATVLKITLDPEFKAWQEERIRKYNECQVCYYWGGRHSPFCPGHEDWEFIRKCIKEDPKHYGHWEKELKEHDRAMEVYPL